MLLDTPYTYYLDNILYILLRYPPPKRRGPSHGGKGLYPYPLLVYIKFKKDIVLSGDGVYLRSTCYPFTADIIGRLLIRK